MKKIVIIGAGPAGLTAAYELLSSGGEYEVTVLEASDRLGGICATVSHNGLRMDLGGHRLFSKDERIMRRWKELMPLQGKPSLDDRLTGSRKPLAEGGPDPEKTDEVLLIRDRSSRIYYKDAYFDYPVVLNGRTLKSLDPITTVRAAASYLRYRVKRLPEKDLESFYINRFGRVLYSMFFEDYTRKLWGRHPSEISASWGSQRVKGLSLTAVFRDMINKKLGLKKAENTQTSLIEQFWYPKLGAGQLWETVAAKVTQLGGRILTGHRVTQVCTDGGRIVSVRCGGEEFFADEFISSMAVSDLAAAMGAPDEIRRISDALPYRDMVIVGLLVDGIKLHRSSGRKTIADNAGDCWIYVQDRRVKLGRIQIFNNWSPYLLKDPLNTVWLGVEYFCAKGSKLWQMSDRQLALLAQRELKSIGIIGECRVLDFHAERVEKAYPAYFGSYCGFGRVREYLDGFENLWCVGRNGQHRYNNMDHSMMTAIEAVGAIEKNSRDKRAVWSVNTDKAYHEHKK